MPHTIELVGGHRDGETLQTPRAERLLYVPGIWPGELATLAEANPNDKFPVLEYERRGRRDNGTLWYQYVRTR